MNYCLKTYTHRLLTLLDYYLTKNILAISLIKENESSQYRKQSNDMLIETENIITRNFITYLLKEMSVII